MRTSLHALLRGMLVMAAFSIAAVAPSRADEAAKDPKDTKDAKAEAGDSDKYAEDTDPVLSVTAHSITVDGKVIKYHATAGYMLLKQEEGKPLVPPGGGPGGTSPGVSDDKDVKKTKEGLELKAKVFFVAYTLDDVADPGTRPVTFAFNGGPGSASIWLHMASMGPRRANLDDEGEAPPPPYKLVDNASTWLDQTDLVFIDPVSTGFSRTFPKEDPKQFHGLREDIASVGDFIRLYTTRNNRWLSPKFVLGESYGTTRAAGLSDYLQDRFGMYLNGIVLVSSCLNFQVFGFGPFNKDPYIDFLPTFATSAWYHKKLAPDLQAKGVAEVADEARAFASGEFMSALAQGDRMSPEDKRKVAAKISRFTGLPVDFVLLRKLRVSDADFFGHLLLAEGKMLGRYDARFTGPRYEPGTEFTYGNPEYDPSSEAVMGPLTAAFNDYVRRELKYESDIPYEGISDVGAWNFGDAGNGYPDTSEDLRHAMTRNPYLKVWVTCSYYDLATPFFNAESVIASMNLDPTVRGNLRFTYYESGHMLYIHNPSRVKFKADFLAFLHDAVGQTQVNTAAR
jgi:carboxypeptidase C (cathepsin A)